MNVNDTDEVETVFCVVLERLCIQDECQDQNVEQADGYVASQRYAVVVNGRFYHSAGTRLSSNSLLSYLNRLSREFNPTVVSNGGSLQTKLLQESREVAVWFNVPATLSKKDFNVLVDKFVATLKECDILKNPIICELRPRLRVVP